MFDFVFHCLCWLLFFCILIFVVCRFCHCVCLIVINLMFDVDISLFMLNLCDTVTRYFDCNHVSMSFYVFTHACMCVAGMHTDRMMVDVQITQLRYTINQMGRRWVGVYYINRHCERGVYRLCWLYLCLYWVSTYSHIYVTDKFSCVEDGVAVRTGQRWMDEQKILKTPKQIRSVHGGDQDYYKRFLKCYFIDLSWHVTKGLLRDYFT